MGVAAAASRALEPCRAGGGGRGMFVSFHRPPILLIEHEHVHTYPHESIDPISKQHSTSSAQQAAQLNAAHGHGRATTAGNELYLLASNFLLYTALVRWRSCLAVMVMVWLDSIGCWFSPGRTDGRTDGPF